MGIGNHGAGTITREELLNQGTIISIGNQMDAMDAMRRGLFGTA